MYDYFYLDSALLLRAKKNSEEATRTFGSVASSSLSVWILLIAVYEMCDVRWTLKIQSSNPSNIHGLTIRYVGNQSTASLFFLIII